MKKYLVLLAALGLPASVYSNGETSSFVDSVWSAAGFVMGYGDRDAYIKYACNGNDPGDGETCEGPAERGMVTTMIDVANSVTSSFDYTKCTDIPTTGDTSAKAKVNGHNVTVDITFAEAKNEIPAEYDGAGDKYDRRLEMSFDIGTVIKMTMESSCSHEKTGFFAINQLVGDQAPGYHRAINVWIGKRDEQPSADVYFAEANDDGDIRSAAGFGMIFDDEAKTYKVWGASDVYYGNSGGSTLTTDAYNFVGNYESHEISIRLNRFVTDGIGGDSRSVSYYDADALADLKHSDDDVLDESSNFDLLTDQSGLGAGDTADGQGCLDFDSPDSAPDSADACDDLDFSKTAPTPVIDSKGKFSASWVIGTMNSKLVDIPELD